MSTDTTRTAAGVVYLIMGVFGLLGNGLTAYLIGTDTEMRNITYCYMVNLCVCDVIIILPIAIYSGLMLIWEQTMHIAALKASAYVAAIGWYCGCLFMVLAAFSRYIQLEKPEKVDSIFRARNVRISVFLSYIVPAAIWTWFAYYDPIPFTFFPERYTWGFHTEQPFAKALSITNISVNSIFAILINCCNVKSLIWVHRMKKQVQGVDMSSNNRREIKLFAQCAITGTIYTATVVFFYVVAALENVFGPIEFLVTHILWTANHLQNPIIYFILNKRLRLCFYRFFRCKRLMHREDSGALTATAAANANCKTAVRMSQVLTSSAAVMAVEDNQL